MTYQVNKYNGTLLATIPDGATNRAATDLVLIGKNYNRYGEAINENLVFLLENFSNPVPPANPITGQVWHDNVSNVMKFFDDSGTWKIIGGAEASVTRPLNPTVGSLWLDVETEQLYAYGDNGYILIGPQTLGSGVTQMVSTRLDSVGGGTKTVIAASIDNDVVAILSPEEFTISSTTTVSGFDVVKKGITLKDTTSDRNGVTDGDYRFWGTASNTEKLGGIAASEYLLRSSSSFDTQVGFSSSGFTVGDVVTLTLEDVTVAKLSINPGSSSSIVFSVSNDQGTNTDSAIFTSHGILPGEAGSSLGSDESPWGTIYATLLEGAATQSNTLLVNGTNYRSASTSGTSNSIAARDSSGNITANVFNGVATSAKYADLAEKYTTDDILPTGTVVIVSKSETSEVTFSDGISDTVGVISEKPAFLMNMDSTGQAVALAGRVPVRVIGAVRKGDVVYATYGGVAMALSTYYGEKKPSTKVGIALETNFSTDEKLVECILKV